MGIKGKCTTKKNGFPDMIANLKAVNGAGVEVGVLKGEHAWLAPIHEYGLKIKVTDGTVPGEGNMRGFLMSQGVFLKKSTTHINIPERSFLRAGYDANRDKVMKKAQEVLKDVASGKTTERGWCQAVGAHLRDSIKDYATELNSPGNHPFTVDRKGSSNPLVDSGDMIGGITWRKAK